jgi:[ribosomal protein S5]-alanine N-acetyltransferase
MKHRACSRRFQPDTQAGFHGLFFISGAGGAPAQDAGCVAEISTWPRVFAEGEVMTHEGRPAGVTGLSAGRAVEVFTRPPPICTPRLMLRPLLDRDEPSFLRAAAMSRPALDRSMPLHLEGESDVAMFRRQLELARGSGGGEWVRLVGVDASGEIVGGFNLSGITRGLHWRADINWWVASDRTGRGYATEAVGALLARALADLPEGMGLHEVHAWITRDNAASARIAQKLGMTRQEEGRAYLLTDASSWVLHDVWITRGK